MKHIHAVASSIVLALTSLSANATGFLLSEQSSLLNGRAYSGAGVVGDDLSAVFFNPAGMTLLPGTRAQAGFMVVGTGFKFTSTDGSVRENGRNKEAPVPALYITHELNNNVWLGLGITTPYGLSTSYQRNWAYAQRGDYAKIISFDINPNIAWKISDQLSVGAGLSAQYAKAKLSMRLAEDPGTNAAGLHGFMDADSWQYGFNAGVMYTPNQNMHFGLSYRSAMTHKAKGDFKVDGLENTVDFVSDTNAKLKTPATVTFSGAWKFSPKWTATTIVRWSKWSNLKNISISNSKAKVASGLASGSDSLKRLIVSQSILANPYIPQEAKRATLASIKTADGLNSFINAMDPGKKAELLEAAHEMAAESAQNLSDINIDANFQDTWLVGAGLDYDVNDAWTVRGGVCYETNPVRNQQDRLAVLPDSTRVWFTLGSSYRPTKNLQIDASICYLKALGTSELYDFQKNGKKVGSYKSHSKFAGIQVQYRF